MSFIIHPIGGLGCFLMDQQRSGEGDKSLIFAIVRAYPSRSCELGHVCLEAADCAGEDLQATTAGASVRAAHPAVRSATEARWFLAVEAGDSRSQRDGG